MSPAAECGFSVATGDPSTIADAASAMGRTADGLDAHGATVLAAAQSLLGPWNGLAASAYQQLSSLVAAHFWEAAGASRSASVALRRYSTELAECQSEGRQAAYEAERWLEHIELEASRLQEAEQEVSAAEDELDQARRQAAGARAVGPARAGEAVRADAAAGAAQLKLASAYAAVQAASTALAQAHEELWLWQARGRRAWEEAQAAGDRTTGSLAVLPITPPPVAHLPAGSRPASPHENRGRDTRRGSRHAGAPTRERPPAHKRPAKHRGDRGGSVAPAAPAVAGRGQGSGTITIPPPPPHRLGGKGSGTITIPLPPPQKSGVPASPRPKPASQPEPGAGSGTTVID